jgi:hypothetical protein
LQVEVEAVLQQEQVEAVVLADILLAGLMLITLAQLEQAVQAVLYQMVLLAV